MTSHDDDDPGRGDPSVIIVMHHMVSLVLTWYEVTLVEVWSRGTWWRSQCWQHQHNIMPLQTHLQLSTCTAGNGGGVEGHGGTGADHASSPHVPPNTVHDTGGGVEGCSGVYSAAHTGTPLHPSKHHAQLIPEVEQRDMWGTGTDHTSSPHAPPNTLLTLVVCLEVLAVLLVLATPVALQVPPNTLHGIQSNGILRYWSWC